MHFGDIVRKYIRLPWEVYDGKQHFKDAEIAQHVAHSCDAKDFFKVRPIPEDYADILFAMAVPLTIAMYRGKAEALKKREKWTALPEGEKRFVLDHLNLDPKRHLSMVSLIKDEEWQFRIASYIAAAFAFTTYLKPQVITFDELADIGTHDFNEESIKAKLIRNSHLLIIVGSGGGHRGSERAYAYISSLLTGRWLHGQGHMIIDAPEGTLLTKMLIGEDITRQDVMKTYEDMFPAKLRMSKFLYGYNVYVDPIERLEREANERRQTVTI
jgi:hypothetical protein